MHHLNTMATPNTLYREICGHGLTLQLEHLDDKTETLRLFERGMKPIAFPEGTTLSNHFSGERIPLSEDSGVGYYKLLRSDDYGLNLPGIARASFYANRRNYVYGTTQAGPKNLGCLDYTELLERFEIGDGCEIELNQRGALGYNLIMMFYGKDTLPSRFPKDTYVVDMSTGKRVPPRDFFYLISASGKYELFINNQSTAQITAKYKRIIDVCEEKGNKLYEYS